MVTICDDCFLKQEEERKQRTLSIKKEKEEAKKEKEKHDSKITFIWAIISGIIVLVITLIICIFNYEKIGIPLTIFLPLIIGS